MWGSKLALNSYCGKCSQLSRPETEFATGLSLVCDWLIILLCSHLELISTLGFLPISVMLAERPIALAEINGFNNTAAAIELAMGNNKVA